MIIIIIIITRRAQLLARKQIDFVAGVSHEFRTPLAVIHAVSENLADGLITDMHADDYPIGLPRHNVRFALSFGMDLYKWRLDMS